MSIAEFYCLKHLWIRLFNKSTDANHSLQWLCWQKHSCYFFKLHCQHQHQNLEHVQTYYKYFKAPYISLLYTMGVVWPWTPQLKSKHDVLYPSILSHHLYHTQYPPTSRSYLCPVWTGALTGDLWCTGRVGYPPGRGPHSLPGCRRSEWPLLSDGRRRGCRAATDRVRSAIPKPPRRRPGAYCYNWPCGGN